MRYTWPWLTLTCKQPGLVVHDLRPLDVLIRLSGMLSHSYAHGPEVIIKIWLTMTTVIVYCLLTSRQSSQLCAWCGKTILTGWFICEARKSKSQFRAWNTFKYLLCHLTTLPKAKRQNPHCIQLRGQLFCPTDSGHRFPAGLNLVFLVSSP